MYYKRIYQYAIQRYTSFFPILTLCGARQTGKTTLLKEVFPSWNYVSLDLPSVAELAEKSPDDFFQRHPAPLIVDEIQYAPGLFRHLKYQVDQNRHTMGQYILTGSQKFNLMKEVSDSLAGRSVILDLENLSWQELASQDTLIPDTQTLSTIITRGQFPELWRVPDFPAGSFHSSYLASYLERDVRQILNVASLRDFERFIRALAPRSGQLLNKTDLARDVGVSVKAINDWLSVLQASNQIALLEPWHQNIGKRIVKTPKIYFCDTGLLCFLLGIGPLTFHNSPFKGQLWETLVFAELRKINQTLDTPVNFWFYRDQLGREIDFLLEQAGRLGFVECKWTQNPDLQDARTIQAIHQELAGHPGPWQNGRHFVVCTSPNPYPLGPGLEAVNIDAIPRVLETACTKTVQD